MAARSAVLSVVLGSAALVLGLAAGSRSALATEPVTIAFTPTSFVGGAAASLRYSGAAIGATVDLAHDETVAGMTRHLTERIGRADAKSGSVDFTAPMPMHDYSVEIREDCSGTFHLGDCALLATARLPLLRPELTLDHGFPGDTLTVRWANAPIGTHLFWFYRIAPGLPRAMQASAGIVDGVTGSRSLVSPGLGAGLLSLPPLLGLFTRCSEGWFGATCDGELAVTAIAPPAIEISVRPAPGYVGEGAWVHYEHAPLHSELRIISSGGVDTYQIGLIDGPGEVERRIDGTGDYGFFVPAFYNAERIELRTPCNAWVFCRFLPSSLFASTPFTIARASFDVTPSAVHPGDVVTIIYEHAPPTAAIALGFSTGFPFNLGEPFANGPSGTAVRVPYDLAPGVHGLTLHATCAYYVNTWIDLHTADCSPTLASTRLTVLSDEPVGAASASPSPTTARLALPGASALATAAPTAFGSSVPVALGSVVPISTTSPIPTSTPEPDPVALSTPAPAAATAPALPSPTAAISIAPIRTTAPTFPPTPTVTATTFPIVVPSQTPPVQTAQPTAANTPKPNTPPQITKISDQTVKAGQLVTIGVSAYDADGDKITLSCGGADKFVDNGNGTGTFQWTATKAGKYTFTCTASDGKAQSSTTFAITVG